MRYFKEKILICLISILCIGCNTKPAANLSLREINNIKKNYSSEVLNYFYEIVFNSELNNSDINFRRWYKNIKIKVLGSPSEKDIIHLDSAMQLIAELNLPIKLKIIDDEAKANMRIFFTDHEDSRFSKHATESGLALTNSIKGVINSTTILIFDGKNKHHKATTIIEELVQSLGLYSDSDSHPGSLFYEHYSSYKKFTELDKKLLKLLYEPALPVNYRKECFERDFSDILYAVNTSDKLLKYIKDKDISVKLLEMIPKGSFEDSLYTKYPRNINVDISGEFGINDSLLVMKSVEALNKISGNINMNIISKSKSSKDPGIYINYTKVRKQKTHIVCAVETNTATGMMFSNRYRCNLNIKYKDTIGIENKMFQAIPSVLYHCLLPIDITYLKDKYHEKNGEISYDRDLETILETSYSNEFADGYKLSDFKNLIRKIKNE